MNYRNIVHLLFVILFQLNNYAQSKKETTILHHNIYAEINVANSKINVRDTIYLSANFFQNGKLAFKLNKNLVPEIKTKGFQLSVVNNTDSFAIYKTYVLSGKNQNKDKFFVVLTYSGIIKDELKNSAIEYARGFSETDGTISEKGIYLAGSTYWLPDFDFEYLISYNLDVLIKNNWLVVSQGKRTINKINGEKRHIRYESPEPMDEVYLVGGKWIEYSLKSGDVLVQAFLRKPDEKLANKYLRMTGVYLKMYERLIGPYPYSKFALVENFWETGYGMPSFTLLGEKIIRMPWILYSSYPHELLHNYWGNSVFVDYSGGNWCEGITAYMADHLLQEDQGKGIAYRRATLQKFTDFVNSENDFPVKQFVNRNNSAEEAIGYGKVLMINDMLRLKYGDKVFLDAYRKFYKDNKFRKASFSDIRRSFESVTGDDLSNFFNQWINRKGAPSLKLANVKVETENDKYTLNFQLDQIQKEEVFNVDIPVAVYLDGDDNIVFERVNMTHRVQNFSFTYDKKPARMDIDPTFQIMRRLDRKEVPTTLTQIFGSKEAIIIIPENSKYLTAYVNMAKIWKQTAEAQGNKILIYPDNKISKVPKDKAVWIFGFENKFASYVDAGKLFPDQLQAKNDLIGKLKVSGAWIFAVPNPDNPDYTVGFAGANSNEAIKALTRKLPHYGKYSYLGFEGDEAKNVFKGILSPNKSPLNYIIDKNAEIKATIKERKALTDSE